MCKGNQEENCLAKEAFNRKITLLTSKLNTELRKLIRLSIWNSPLHDSETWKQRKLERKFLEIF
jgi:hypothetical protein